MIFSPGLPLSWRDLNTDITVDHDFTMMHVMLMLIFDCVLFFVIDWYVSEISPGEYGIPKPWYFPVQVRH